MQRPRGSVSQIAVHADSAGSPRDTGPMPQDPMPQDIEDIIASVTAAGDSWQSVIGELFRHLDAATRTVNLIDDPATRRALLARLAVSRSSLRQAASGLQGQLQTLSRFKPMRAAALPSRFDLIVGGRADPGRADDA